MLVESNSRGGNYRLYIVLSLNNRKALSHEPTRGRNNMRSWLSVQWHVLGEYQPRYFWGSSLVYFPLLRGGIVFPTHEKLNAPDHKRKEYVHPPPPHLRRVIEDYGIPPSGR